MLDARGHHRHHLLRPSRTSSSLPGETLHGPRRSPGSADRGAAANQRLANAALTLPARALLRRRLMQMSFNVKPPHRGVEHDMRTTSGAALDRRQSRMRPLAVPCAIPATPQHPGHEQGPVAPRRDRVNHTNRPRVDPHLGERISPIAVPPITPSERRKGAQPTDPAPRLQDLPAPPARSARGRRMMINTVIPAEPAVASAFRADDFCLMSNRSRSRARPRRRLSLCFRRRSPCASRQDGSDRKRRQVGLGHAPALGEG